MQAGSVFNGLSISIKTIEGASFSGADNSAFLFRSRVACIVHIFLVSIFFLGNINVADE